MGHRLENGMENGNGNLGKWNLRISSLFLRVEGMGSTEVHPYAELLGNESHGWVSESTTWKGRNVEMHKGNGIPCQEQVVGMSAQSGPATVVDRWAECQGEGKDNARPYIQIAETPEGHTVMRTLSCRQCGARRAFLRPPEGKSEGLGSVTQQLCRRFGERRC